jgi:SM-20-related protein
MQYLSYAVIARSPLQFDPFQYVIVPNCIERDALKKINSDFPTVPGPGSHPPSELEVRGHFAGLLKELEGPLFRDAVEKKFGIDLEQRPTICTVRGYLQKKTEGSTRTARRRLSPSCSISTNTGVKKGDGYACCATART